MTARALSFVPFPAPKKIEELLSGKGLTAAGAQYVLDVANSDPQRKVGRRRKRNVILNVAMQRLGVTLQAESLSGEYLLLIDLDHRRDVLNVYDQPTSVRVAIDQGVLEGQRQAQGQGRGRWRQAVPGFACRSPGSPADPRSGPRHAGTRALRTGGDVCPCGQGRGRQAGRRRRRSRGGLIRSRIPIPIIQKISRGIHNVPYQRTDR